MFYRRKQKVFKHSFVRFDMFGWFFNKKEVEQVKEDTKKSFESVKKDIDLVSNWIKYFNSEKDTQQKEIVEVKDILSSVQEEIGELKNMVSVISELKPNRLFKTPGQLSNKQTTVYAVQSAVRTGVQTPKLDQFSVTERAILWILLNTDMKLSYDDLATMLGKERSTIRGQINTIKQKGELIEESIERNGKKRLFIPESIKEKMLKKSKVSVNLNKNGKKTQKK